MIDISREFEKRDKRIQKMTRDGLVEKNLATGEQQRVSQRGQDFNLQARRQDAEVGGGFAPSPGQRQPPSAAQSNYQAPENPSDAPQNTDALPHEALQTPSAPRHGAENRQHSAQNTVGAPRRRAQRPGRMHFDEPTQTSPSASSKQRSTQYQRKFADVEKPEQPPAAENAREIITPAASTNGPHSDKLRFASDEKPPEPISDKLSKARSRAERVDGKLQRARDKLPVKRRVRLERSFDEEKEKLTRKFHIEKEVKSRSAHIKGPLPLRPLKAGTNLAIGYAHRKLHQVEHENTGIEAAHKTELAAEGLTRSALRFRKTRPYRRVAKLEHASAKAQVMLAYQQALNDNPKLKSNALSRFMQKQKIKRQYAKAAREAKRTVQRAKRAGEAAGKATSAVAGFVRKHPVIAVGIVLILLFLFIFSGMFASCSNMAGAGFSSVVMSSYLAEDMDIDGAELSYTGWEADLQLEINNAEITHPGYDEYRYDIDDISHNPFELMAYLTARYQYFKYADVEADLRAIFDEQYTLEFIPEVEIRYRTETHTNPDTGESYSVQVPYEWHILNINLTALHFIDVIMPRMDTGERERYNKYMQTRGNRQYIISPFDFDWIPYISAYYGWRVDPDTGVKDFHKGIDIEVPAGTDVLAGHDGRVTTVAYDADYGWYVVIGDNMGVESKYAHCGSILVNVGQEVVKGEVIAKSGSPHLHLEVLKNGQHLNPLYFAESLYDPVGGLMPDIPDYPGAPMSDSRYAALMEEAMKHLGKPYVFGASGPNSFDCSGFVCYALNHSGVASVGRTNAQGLYNKTTPVSRANAQPGDLIFFKNTRSAPQIVTHVAIVRPDRAKLAAE